MEMHTGRTNPLLPRGGLLFLQVGEDGTQVPV